MPQTPKGRRTMTGSVNKCILIGYVGRDPELRAKLTPNYRAACKRLVMSDGFYDAIQQPDAELVTAAIDHLEPEGIRTADGVLHPLDVERSNDFSLGNLTDPVTNTGIETLGVWKTEDFSFVANYTYVRAVETLSSAGSLPFQLGTAGDDPSRSARSATRARA